MCGSVYGFVRPCRYIKFGMVVFFHKVAPLLASLMICWYYLSKGEKNVCGGSALRNVTRHILEITPFAPIRGR